MATQDPLIEANRRAMEYIWNKVPKEAKDGIDYVTYVKTDIPYLYYSGLVDTQKYTLENWEKAFEDCLGEDSRYWISHEKMIWLGRFRYCRTVNDPFDPLKMRIGVYEVDRLWKVFEYSVIPSTSLPAAYIKNFFDAIIRQKKSLKELIPKEIEKMKEDGKEVGVEVADFHPNIIEAKGKQFIQIYKETLESLKNLVDTYPSPRRKLELSVYNSRRDKLQELADVAANPQKSSFEAGVDFRETTKKSLKDMLVKASENKTGGRKPKDEVIDLKNMQNKRPTKY